MATVTEPVKTETAALPQCSPGLPPVKDWYVVRIVKGRTATIKCPERFNRTYLEEHIAAKKNVEVVGTKPLNGGALLTVYTLAKNRSRTEADDVLKTLGMSAEAVRLPLFIAVSFVDQNKNLLAGMTKELADVIKEAINDSDAQLPLLQDVTTWEAYSKDLPAEATFDTLPWPQPIPEAKVDKATRKTSTKKRKSSKRTKKGSPSTKKAKK